MNTQPRPLNDIEADLHNACLALQTGRTPDDRRTAFDRMRALKGEQAAHPAYDAIGIERGRGIAA